ncbi:unnamed protein product [Urochloa humidicola]
MLHVTAPSKITYGQNCLSIRDRKTPRSHYKSKPNPPKQIHMNGGKFTWSNNQENPTLEKLGKALMSRDWEDIFPGVSIHKLPREVSDHNPLILTTSMPQPRKHLSFRFETSWMKHPDYKKRVAEIWEKPCYAKTALDRVQTKLKRFKQYFKGWGFDKQGQQRTIKLEAQNELLELEKMEEEQILNLQQMHRKIELQKLLMDMLEEEELYWAKRSHEKWLLEGDNNTDFFHRIANGRRRKGIIVSLKKGDELIEGDEEILKHATDYYKDLFGPAPGNVFPLDPGMWGAHEKVNSEDNEWLTRPFSEEEIKGALFQMERNKAAGPDSIPIEFFQSCWEIIREDILDLFNDFHQGKMDVSRLNYRIITLLPKVKEAEKIQQYRPICLLNCLYKWITKVLSIRLEMVNEKLILKNQSAFMKGRNIMNSILALHEILHETKKQGKTGIVLKLDFEKAYDKVN